MTSALDLLLLLRRRWLLYAAGAGAASYGAYRLYHHPTVTFHRRRLSLLATAVLSTAETFALLTDDLNLFLKSDSDELPRSLKQFCKLTSSPEFSDSVSVTSEALTVGILRGYRKISPDSGPGFTDQVLDRIVSPTGAGFMSVVVGSFARELVLAFYSKGEVSGEGSETEPRWAKLMMGDQGRVLVGDCVERFVSTAVGVFLEKTMDINTYDQLFSGLTNPNHGGEVKDVLVAVCNNAIETLVKTSHQVMTGPSSDSPQNRVEEVSGNSEEKSSKSGKEGGGWVGQVSSTLAVPSTRSFILDVTGRVTFETVRSFLEFLLRKMHDGAKRSVSAVREEVVGRGLEVMRYISTKTTVILTVCFALCMKVLGGTRVLMPA